jgi:mannose-6-phosphate isomerase
VPELLSVLLFDSPPVLPSRTVTLASGEVRYQTPAPEFRLSRIELGPEQRFVSAVTAPEILLCVEGQASVELGSVEPGGSTEPGQAELVPRSPAAHRALRRGQACFLPASSRGYELRGSACVFRATVGESTE